jgi:phosphatidyl-myo-inositol dimannoside synthase
MAPCHSRIELWAPDLDATRGGVQAFSWFFLRALQTSASGNPIRVRTKVGTASKEFYDRPGFEIRSSGYLPRWTRSAGFATQLLLPNLIDPPALIITTHAHFAPVAHMLKRLRGVPYVVVAHGIEVWGRIGTMRCKALCAAARVFAVSRYTASRLCADQGVDLQRIALLPNTFAEDHFYPGPKPTTLLARHGLTRDQKIIFTLCRLAASERYKGYDLILEALPAIRALVPEVHYVIGGTGDDLPRLRALVRARGLEAHVTLAGFIPAEELPDYYRLCDVFAMPSTGEGFGIVFLEAMASGKPVLAGNRDGSTDALGDGQFGVLADPTDAAQIASKIVEILLGQGCNPLIFQGSELRRQVVAEFGHDRFCRRLTASLSGLLPGLVANQ